MNGKYVAVEHRTEVTVFKELSAYLLTAWLCKIADQTLQSKILLIYVLQMTKCHIQVN